jgi:hypothetical protein
MKGEWHVVRMGERTDAYRILVGRPELRRSLERTRISWEDNIKVDFQEVEWEGMGWTDVAEDRDRWPALGNAVKNLRVP